MARFTYCFAFYGSVSIDADNREDADKIFDEFDTCDLRDYEDDWALTLVQEETDDGKTIDHIM